MQRFAATVSSVRTATSIATASSVATFFVVALVALSSPLPTRAATITIDSTADESGQPANGNCTLREAVLAANTNTPVDGCPAGGAGPGTVDVIAVPSGTYLLTIGPRGDDASMRGDLDLTDDVEIVGAGADVCRVDGNGIDRIFDVHSGVSALISGLEIAGGDAGSGNGGGIQNGGNLTLEESSVRGNNADGPGGGIRNNSVLTVRRCLLVGNQTADHGGGMDNHGDVMVENSTASGNDGGNLGGGLYNLDGVNMILMHVTVHANTAGGGSAIHNAGNLTATNSLISGSCSGTVDTSGGGNLETPLSTCGLGPGDLTNIAAAGLASLATNGGATETHALLAGSLAIDTAVSGPCLATDQRGAPRPADGNGDTVAECDIGAFETGSQAVEIFADSFESGDFSAW